MTLQKIFFVAILVFFSSCRPSGVNSESNSINSKDSIIFKREIDNILKMSTHATDYELAIHYIDSARKIAQQSKFIYGELKCIASLVRIEFDYNNQAHQKINLLIDTLDQLVNKQEKWKKYQYYVKYIKGSRWVSLNMFDSATHYYKESLLENHHDSEMYYNTIAELAYIDYQLDNYTSAIKFNQILLNKDIHNKDTFHIIQSLFGLCDNFVKMYDTLNIRNTLQIAHQYILQDSNRFEKLNMDYYYQSAVFYATFTSNMDSAILNYLNGLRISRLHPDRYQLDIQIHKLGLALCYISKKDFAQASKYFDEVNADLHGDIDSTDYALFRNYWQAGYKVYQYKGDYKKAIALIEKGYDFEDSMRAKDLNTQFLELEKDLKRLEAKNIIADKNAKLTKANHLITLLILGIFILLLLAFFFYKAYKQRAQLNKLQYDKKILFTKIEERNRIAQEMHDNLGSTLTSMQMAVDLYMQRPTDSKNTDRINLICDEMQEQINEVIWRLNSSNDYIQDLLKYINNYVHKINELGKLKLTVHSGIENTSIPMDSSLRYAIFICVKEIVNNIMKHAQATHAQIYLDYQPSTLEVIIQDNGKGFDEQSVLNKGNGLNNIKTSIIRLGGQCSIVTKNGTKFMLSIPIH